MNHRLQRKAKGEHIDFLLAIPFWCVWPNWVLAADCCSNGLFVFWGGDVSLQSCLALHYSVPWRDEQTDSGACREGTGGIRGGQSNYTQLSDRAAGARATYVWKMHVKQTQMKWWDERVTGKWPRVMCAHLVASYCVAKHMMNKVKEVKPEQQSLLEPL